MLLRLARVGSLLFLFMCFAVCAVLVVPLAIWLKIFGVVLCVGWLIYLLLHHVFHYFPQSIVGLTPLEGERWLLTRRDHRVQEVVLRHYALLPGLIVFRFKAKKLFFINVLWVEKLRFLRVKLLF